MRRIMSLPMILFVVTFAAIGSLMLYQIKAAGGNTYYVSPGGSDSAAGSATAPWKTLQFSFGKLTAGDTLVVKGGSYSGTLSASPNGTSTAPVTVKAAAGERPVLTGLVRLTNANYLVWDGINVTFPTTATSGDHMFKLTGGVGWRITNSEIWGAKSYAGMLVAGTPSKWRIDHNYFHHTYPSNSTNQDHLIYVNGGEGGGVITRNLFNTSPNGRGVKIGPPSGSTSPIGNVEISYNTFYNNTGPSNIQLSYGAKGNKIFRNLMVKSSQGNITGYDLNGTGNVAYDNVGWDSTAVITHSGGSTKITDQGGNVHEDPRLNLTTFRPENTKFTEYGRYASGDTAVSGPENPTNPPVTTDTQAPTVPSGLQTFMTAPTIVQLTWSASTDNVGIAGYNVYRNGSLLTKVGKVTDFLNSNLNPSTTYTYQLEAFDVAGNKSVKSASVSVTTPSATTPIVDTTPPAVSIIAPSNGSAVRGTYGVTANASDNVGVSRVEFWLDGVLKTSDTSAPYGFEWDTTGLVGDHDLDARAVDTAGNAKVASVTVTTNSSAPTSGLPTPTGLTAQSITSSQINLRWNPSATHRIDVYRNGAKIGTTSSDSKYGDTYKLEAGKSYEYYIIARDEKGRVSAPSVKVTATTLSSTTSSPNLSPRS